MVAIVGMNCRSVATIGVLKKRFTVIAADFAPQASRGMRCTISWAF